MNIDYAKIIATANVRKEALEAFALAAQALGAEINESHEPDLISAARDFQKAVQALDAEAHALLPPNFVQPVAQFVSNLLAMWAYVDKIGSGAFAVQITPRNALYSLVES